VSPVIKDGKRKPCGGMLKRGLVKPPLSQKTFSI
jgi:hypothetical protein